MPDPHPREYRLYGLLNHPLRAQLLTFLSQQGPTSFTQLKKTTGASVGSLYYHLSVLGELITQDAKKRYLLSDLGQAALRHLRSAPTGGNPMDPGTHTPILDRLAPILSGSLFFQGIALSPFRHLPEAVLIMLIVAWLVSASGLEARMLFLFESAAPFTTLTLTFIGSWLSLYALSNLLSSIAFRSRAGHLSLLTCSAYAMIPSILFALLWGNRSPLPLLDGWPFRLLFFALQAWSLLLLSAALRICKRLDATRAYLIVLILAYANIAFILLERIP